MSSSKPKLAIATVVIPNEDVRTLVGGDWVATEETKYGVYLPDKEAVVLLSESPEKARERYSALRKSIKRDTK